MAELAGETQSVLSLVMELALGERRRGRPCRRVAMRGSSTGRSLGSTAPPSSS
jgi:hypothetical protein